ncbi:hypothetical protein HMF7854_04475 [Sphingomonas ginkgonis]|uniref:Bacteriophage tail tape measure N-terminal domain-containing protein n=1 Tax=Sphingomonas ginkgonis TaxID=2315330 RepID=A0A3R9Y4S3_9SPHN|nr:hypothetical protein [Sphingomonas ginkgonis]RST30164.1 hypothetical protein HMF7854_04475 [Sphingomonas ginkgonis]
MDDGLPSLEVGFAIDTAGSFEQLSRLQQVMTSTEAKVIADASKIERATAGMVKLGGASAEITSFANASTQAAATAAAAMARATKAGEALSRQMERQITTFGMSRAAAAALAAEQTGNAELAERLRSQEAALSGMREKAAAATNAEAQAVRDAAGAYRMFEAVAQQRMAAYREEQAAEAATARQAEAARTRAAAEQAVNAQLLERGRLQVLLEQNTGAGRMSATDGGATFSALAAKAAQDEARAQADAAATAQRLAAAHAELAAKVQGSYAAQEADAAAAERLRLTTDPLYAATKRLNAEIAESTRLYYSGATAPAEYARQQEVLRGRLAAAASEHEQLATSAGRSGFAMRQFAIQLPDIAQGLLTGQKPMQVFLQQGGQIAQIGMLAEGGLKGFALQLGGLVAAFTPLIAAAALGGAALLGVKQAAASDAEMKKYAESLGLTHAEMKKLKDQTVTWGDVTKATFQVIAEHAGFTAGGISSFFSNAFQKIGEFGKFSVQIILAAFASAVKGIYSLFANLPGIIGNAAVGAANLAIAAFEKMVNLGVAALNKIGSTINAVFKTNIAPVADVALGRIQTSFKGTLGNVGKDIGAQFKGTFADIDRGFDKISARATQNARERLKNKAAEIIADRTPKKPPKPKEDHHAEQLAREAEATEAQIRNLYALADAYRVSGAAALIAEARVKAESDAIKKRADIEELVDRQIRLSIAQRVSDAAKATAGMRDQASAQDKVNAMVAAGTVPAERAAELVKGQIADLPLLAAVEAAQQRGLVTEAGRATAALADQRAERERLAAVERKAQYLAAADQGDKQLAQLREELRLVGATDAVRVHALAVVRATQDAEKFNPEDRAAYIAQQVAIADQTQALATAQDSYNNALSYTATLLGTVNGQAQEMADSLSAAFGNVGSGVGQALTALTSYAAVQAKLDEDHRAALKAAGSDAARAARADVLYAKQSGTARQQATMQAIGGLKSLFKEHSTGYKVMSDIEKAYAAFQAAQTIASIARDVAKTASSLANSAARTTANTAEGGSKIFAELGPWAFPVVAAMVAVIAALGFRGGGGGRSTAPMSADDLQKKAGTGTVFGAPDEKSASIAHSLELVAANTDGALQSSNEMLKSLRSIDTSITAMAGAVAQQINVAGSLFDTSKLNLGSSGSGGFLGIGAKNTTRTLYDAGITLAATTVGNIVANGISGSTYQTVEQIKKKSGFLGIGGSTKTSYQTSNSGLDGSITSAVQSVIVNLRNGLVTAAGAIGIDGAKAMLDSFQVNIGKVSFKDMSGAEIKDQLNAIFSSVGDQMASSIFPMVTQFQKVGEGAFETLVRVASTFQAVGDSLKMLGTSAANLGIAARMGLADQFETIGDLTSTVNAYFKTYYSEAEQSAAKTAQLATVFASLGLSMPGTLAGFRQLVEAQDLTTSAGQEVYATLLKIAPAFADLQSSLEGAKSAADVLSERQNLQRQLLELQGNTAELRRLDLLKLDESNRALQLQIWAIQDGQDAAKAADDLRKAWTSVGDSIMDEVKRIRGLSDGTGAGTFASLLGQFNVATASARIGDQDAAKSLPQLSQALLTAAANAATSRQELDRIQTETANSLQATYGLISNFGDAASASSNAALLNAAAATQAAAPATNDNGSASLVDEVRQLREEVAQLRADNNAGHAATASNTGKVARILDTVTADSGGNAVATVIAA